MAGHSYAPILVQDFVEGEDLSASAFCVDGRVLVFQAYKPVVRTFSRQDDPRRDGVLRLPQPSDLVGRAAALARCATEWSISTRASVPRARSA
jgi:hypothetical protein